MFIHSASPTTAAKEIERNSTVKSKPLQTPYPHPLIINHEIKKEKTPGSFKKTISWDNRRCQQTGQTTTERKDRTKDPRRQRRYGYLLNSSA